MRVSQSGDMAHKGYEFITHVQLWGANQRANQSVRHLSTTSYGQLSIGLFGTMAYTIFLWNTQF
jgi:hypothetical protein